MITELIEEKIKMSASTIRIFHPVSKIPLRETEEGLVDKNNKLVFRLLNGAYRITADDNYTDNFGLEWNTFQKTQIDKFSGSDISKVRFF